MNDKKKIEAILNLLTDKNVGKVDTSNNDERFGALLAFGYAFKEANKIANK